MCTLAFGLFVAAWGAAGLSSQQTAEVRGELVRYGSAPSEFGELWVPAAGSTNPRPVVVMIHGGFWQRRSADYQIMSEMSEVLFASGFAVWNIEYGRVGERNGGWPHTLEHVGSAIDHVHQLAELHPIDPSRVGVVGHSAGGQLAIWTVGRDDLDSGDPGANPAVMPSVVIALAPVQDVERADREGLGDDATSKLLGGHVEDVPDRYRVLGVGRGSPDVLVVVGSLDDTVPEAIAIGRFEDSGSRVRRIEGLGHFGLLSTSGESMQLIEVELEHLRQPGE